MFVLTLAHFVFVAMRGGTMFYYFSYYVDQARLAEFLQRVGLPQATAAQPDGGHSLMNVLGLIINADRHEHRVGRIQPVQHREPGRDRRRRRRVDVPRDAVRQTRRGARRASRSRRSSSPAFVLLPAGSIGATYGLELVRALVVRADDSAHLGDVRRRRRLRGMEDRPPRDGCRLRDDSRSRSRPV